MCDLSRENVPYGLPFWNGEPFVRDGMPFERLELSVQKQLGAVRTAGAIRSKTIRSRLNSWSYPFQKNWEPFELFF